MLFLNFIFKKLILPAEPGLQAMSGNLSENDIANLILKNQSFKDLLAKNPGGDTLRTVLTVKGDHFFNLFRSKAGIDEFKDGLLNILMIIGLKESILKILTMILKISSVLNSILICMTGSTGKNNPVFCLQIYRQTKL